MLDNDISIKYSHFAIIGLAAIVIDKEIIISVQPVQDDRPPALLLCWSLTTVSLDDALHATDTCKHQPYSHVRLYAVIARAWLHRCRHAAIRALCNMGQTDGLAIIYLDVLT